MVFSFVVSLPAPNLTPTHELASALVNSWHGSMFVATADGSADSDGSSDAIVSDGAGAIVSEASGGALALAMIGATADGLAPPVQPATASAATTASPAVARGTLKRGRVMA
jgi:hypothetical protein